MSVLDGHLKRTIRNGRGISSPTVDQPTSSDRLNLYVPFINIIFTENIVDCEAANSTNGNQDNDEVRVT